MEPVQLLGSPPLPELGCWIGCSTLHEVIGCATISQTAVTEFDWIARRLWAGSNIFSLLGYPRRPRLRVVVASSASAAAAT
eukprot:scaffold38587_cov72-Phaeocystis_antarctica.AAC.1